MRPLLPINELKDLRNSLVKSLALWGQGGDGFYRSSPYSKSTPSFTNTGIVLQAFVESKNTHLAQNLADLLLQSLSTKYLGVFPHEKAQSFQDAHVMCNAWAAFSILEAFPNRVGELASIGEWFLENQRDNCSWPLLPGGETQEPIVTGYAVSALQQIHRCLVQASEAGGSVSTALQPKRIEKAIDLAVNYLMDARPTSVKRQGLYLWPASIGPGAPLLSLGTSALCMHVLAKWGRYRGRDDLVSGVASTLRRLVTTFPQENSYLEIEGHRLAIWDQLHINEGSINYMWYFFAPICAVTILQFAERPEFEDCPEFIEFICRFVNWIEDHVREVSGGSVGISGGETLAEPKVWSTGLAVIVLSRVMERRDLFRIDELIKRRVEHDTVKYKMIEIAGNYNKPPAKWQISVGSFLLIGAGAAVGFHFIYPALAPANWQKYEGIIFFVHMVTVTVLGVFGLKARLRRLVDRALRPVLAFCRIPRVMRDVNHLFGRQTQLTDSPLSSGAVLPEKR